MANRTRRGSANREEENGGRRPVRGAGKGGLPIVPLVILLGMIGGAVILARAIADTQKAEEEPEAAPVSTGPKPFEEYTEEPPVRRETSRGGKYPPAPEGLADSNPDWAVALKIGAEAGALFDVAQVARRGDDTEVFSVKGKAAKEKFDEAFTMTAIWEEELLEKYGDRDRQVKAIMRTRTAWSDKMRFLHKSTGR